MAGRTTSPRSAPSTTPASTAASADPTPNTASSRPSSTSTTLKPSLPGKRRRRSSGWQSRRQARVPGRCAVRCRSSLTARVRQNPPRTRLSASNRMMLHQRRCEARFQPQGREGTCGLAKRLCVPPSARIWGIQNRLPSALWPEMGNQQVPKTRWRPALPLSTSSP